jgi:hypothetical protein
MVTNVFFDSILLSGCGYAFWRGGPPERLGATIFVAAVVLTRVAISGAGTRYSSVEVGVFVVDLLTLAALLALALFSNRLWPLWVTALHIIGTTGHAVRLVDPTLIRWAYAFVLAFWSYPMLLLLVLGTWNHQRRKARFGADKSWSSSSDRWDRRPPGGPTAWSPNSDRSPPL